MTFLKASNIDFIIFINASTILGTKSLIAYMIFNTISNSIFANVGAYSENLDNNTTTITKIFSAIVSILERKSSSVVTNKEINISDISGINSFRTFNISINNDASRVPNLFMPSTILPSSKDANNSKDLMKI